MTSDSPAPAQHRSGFVALCGRPNVGKSTLLNALLGQTLAVANARPQTTRQRLLGIWTTDEFQIVLVDTPGIHRPRSALNRYMVDEALRAARGVDLVLFLAEAPRLPDGAALDDWTPGEVALEGLTAMAELGHPVVLVLTKIDRLADRDHLLVVIERWMAQHDFAAVVPTSAVEGVGLDELRQELAARLPVGPRYYDADQLSDRDMRWHAGELVRGELLVHLGEELPYSCAVTITSFTERDDSDLVRAIIHVERDSQKGMVIGKGGAMIKKISMAARAKIAELTGRPCDLRLRVGVAKNWTKDPDALSRLGYHEEVDS
jgi:GTP-binding protein Era